MRFLVKPPGKGRRVTGTGAPDPQNAAHVGYVQINHLSGYAGSAGWPDWELPFIEWAEREGFEIAVCTNAEVPTGTDRERMGDRRRAEHALIVAAGRDTFSFGGCTSSCLRRSMNQRPAGPGGLSVR